MAARASIYVVDAESTPLGHTFTPTGNPGDANTMIWQLLPASGIGLGSEVIKMNYRPPVNGSPMHKTEIRLWMPTLEVSSGGTGSGYVAQPSLAYANQIIVTALMHQRSILQERKNIRTMAYGLLALANPWRNAVENYDPVY